jgi:hypothetical protein
MTVDQLAALTADGRKLLGDEMRERLDQLANSGTMRTDLWPHVRLTRPLPADTITALTAAAPAVALPDGEIPWSGTLMMVDTPTGDGRDFAGAGTTMRPTETNTWPFMVQLTTPEMGGHAGAFLAGRIVEADLSAFPKVTGSGVFADTPEARAAAAHYAAGNTSGISVDLAITDYDMEFVEEEDDEGEMWIVDVIFHGLEQQIMGATGTPFPAFADAQIHLDLDNSITVTDDDDEEEDEEEEEEDEAVTASAADSAFIPYVQAEPLDVLLASAAATLPDPSAFTLPDEPIPWTVENGTVRGYVAFWQDDDGGEMCHIGYSDQCVCPPRSETGYARFLLKDMECADGSKVAVGPICLRGGHAGAYGDERAALDHYDNTDSIAAWVTCGENDWGIAVAGIVQPDLDDAQLMKLSLASPSGDWRPYPTGRPTSREMVAVSMVPVPGFPQVVAASGFRPRLHVRNGAVESLVAAGAAGPAKLKADALAAAAPVTRADLDAILARLSATEEENRRLSAALSLLGPDVEARAMERVAAVG